MKYYYLFEIVFPSLYFSIAVWMMLTALRGLVSERPTVVKGGTSALLISFFLAPIFLFCATVVVYGPRNGGPDWNEFGLVAIPLLLLFCFRYRNTLLVVGANRQKLADELGAIAKSQNWSFQKGISGKFAQAKQMQVGIISCGRFFNLLIPRTKDTTVTPQSIRAKLYSEMVNTPLGFSATSYLVQGFLGGLLACTAVGMYFFA